MTEPENDQQAPKQDEQRLRNEPSVMSLVLRGIAIIIGAFFSAGVIMELHRPWGH
jgi:hypothetical protein